MMMNRNRLIIALLFALGLLLSNGLMAQNERRKRPKLTAEQRAARLDKMMARMKDSLSLSDDQTGKIKALNIKMRTKMMAARKQYSDDRQMMREEMMDLRIRYQKGVKKVLDKKQWKKFKKMEAERQKRRRERWKNRKKDNKG
ncbi:hypothetical protein [Microscilla marina]|uniref:DUF4890 domain-containing protein n=1 Tax=Microscilla marina ATCC 23134 TaxID=313606 RepID=A1ZF05_MICM2|nr:hypothetical protein [Microscilla marina]EAY31107.1 hypothetical protein M23134_07515 [Microscilla marina ATCC 23134]